MRRLIPLTKPDPQRPMRVTTGRVIDGRIEIEGDALLGGKIPKVVILDDETVPVTEEEKQFRLDSMAAAGRGDTTDGYEFVQSLRRPD